LDPKQKEIPMPIRGKKNPFPKITKMTNSGMFSHGTAGGKQKLDPTPKLPAAVTRAAKEAMKKTNYKSGH
jgi:hypothetical protein